MSRPLRKGDRVTATGTVAHTNRTNDRAGVIWNGTSETSFLPLSALTLIAPAEPPVGSAILKDGVVWTHIGYYGGLGTDSNPYALFDQGWHDPLSGLRHYWSDGYLHDGDVIFARTVDSDD